MSAPATGASFSSPPRHRRAALAAGAICALVACSEAPRARDAAGDAATDAGVDRQLLEGGGEAIVVDLTPGSNDRCGGGDLLQLSGGRLQISATTSGASNEYGSSVRCGGQLAFAGPQRYFALDVAADRVYLITLAPDFDAALYAFSACQPALINADCSSAGAMGFAATVAAGGETTVIFAPHAAGRFQLAVDGATDDDAGGFSLEVEERGAPANSLCLAAQPLQLVGGAAAASGSTLGAADELAVDCQLGVDFDAPQVYYSVPLKGGESYRIALEAQFPAALYLFSELAGCAPQNIDLDCGTRAGTVLPAVPPQQTTATLFTPIASGSYVLAVDSQQSAAAGDFALSIERFTPPPGMRCPTAEPLQLVDGLSVARGDTSAMLNDLGAHVFCGGPRMVGPQHYYTVDLSADSRYRLLLEPAFDAALLLGQSCDTLPIDCASQGASGASLAVPAGSSGQLVFAPPTSGGYVVAVDSVADDRSGRFFLEIREVAPPTNGSCAAPLALVPAPDGTAEVAGDTGPLENDLVGVDCGDAAGPWPGPQAYFLLTVPAGGTADVDVVPEALFDAALYAFPAATACEAAAVDAACAGLSSDTVGEGVDESLQITAGPADEAYLVVVDSWSPSEVGSFTLRVALH